MKTKKIIYGILLLIPLCLPQVIDNQYYIQGVFCRIIIYAMLVASLDLIVGYIGDVSIGHAGFFAIGAYTVGILTATQDLNSDSTMSWFPHLSFFSALPIGILLTAIAGFVLGFPALRLSGPYLAVVTIAYGMLIYTFINEQEAFTNGTKGISLEPLQVFGIKCSGSNFLYVVYPFLVLVMFVVRNLTKSYWGRAFEAIKYSEVAASMCGISKSYYKIWAFVISAGIAGLAGGFFSQLDAYVAPNTFSYNFSVEFLIALIVGGVQSILGNILGASVMVIFPDLFSNFNDYRLIIFGLSLLMVLFFMPKGLAGFVNLVKKRFATKQDSHHAEALSKKAAEVVLFDYTNAKENHTAVQITDLTMRFGGLVAVNELNMSIKKGTVHGLIGPNGSGKSTTVNLLTGIYAPAGGAVSLFGQSIAGQSTYKRAKLGIARTFQNLQLFSDMTALQNVMVGMHNSFQANLAAVCFNLPNAQREEKRAEARAFAWLQFVGLQESAFTEAKNLSYGQARLLEIARALASNPALLLLDEPAAGLTAGEIEKINVLIRKIKDSGVSVLLIEHHMDMVMAVSDEVTVLDFGKKIAEGTPAQIQNNPAVITAYLGTHETSFH